MLLSVVLFSVFTFQSCEDPIPDCELYNFGDVTFYDNGPSWVWDGCYIEVDWADGESNSGTFYDKTSYFGKSAGRADVYMEWEDNENYYWSYGYITLIKCGHVDAYCTWNNKKSATEYEFIIKKSGIVLKTENTPIDELRKMNIK
jgi:uncharacterized protein YraI